MSEGEAVEETRSVLGRDRSRTDLGMKRVIRELKCEEKGGCLSFFSRLGGARREKKQQHT